MVGGSGVFERRAKTEKGKTETVERYHLACSVQNDRSQDGTCIKAIRRAELMHEGCIGGLQVNPLRSNREERIW